MATATREHSDGTGYCRGCGTTIGEEHHQDCELPHKICTPAEYFFLYRPKGKHSVCFDYDAAGNVAVWYLTPNV